MNWSADTIKDGKSEKHNMALPPIKEYIENQPTKDIQKYRVQVEL